MSGLTITMGAASLSSGSTICNAMSSRFSRPTWGAASPTPLSRSMVSIMASASARSCASKVSTPGICRRRMGSP